MLTRFSLHSLVLDSFVTRSVYDLKSRLQSINSDLSIYAGLPENIVSSIIQKLQASGDTVEAVWMHKEVNTEEVNIESKIKNALSKFDVPLKMVHGRSLLHPEDLDFPIQELPDVYTSFRKRVEGQGWREPLPSPNKLMPYPKEGIDVDDAEGVYSLDGKQELADVQQVITALCKPLNEHPEPMNHTKLASKELDQVSSALPFKGGETEALQHLESYFGTAEKPGPAAHYKQTRNGLLGVDYSTKFSSALVHGLLSPRQIAQKAEDLDKAMGKKDRSGGGYWIVFELLWRDYFFFVGWKYGSAMFTLEGIEGQLNPKQARQHASEWLAPDSLENPDDHFVKWAKGETGVPLVDASQKELIQTGFQSNRSRQNVASFLTKDLYYDWRLGAEFFESLLVDYDPNSNWLNWAYVAGVGNDPRSSRQFNVIKQAKDYDSKGDYLVTWLPALKSLHGKNEVFHPWTSQQGVPEGYPKRPIVETGMWRHHYAARGEGGGGGRGRGGWRGGGRGGNNRGRGGNNNRRGGHQQQQQGGS